ncbi:MAG: hypothetical protein K8L91_20030 [Anaerolineae bacterium]|nr:hypothetical protein [Anaerolineae bacterium]
MGIVTPTALINEIIDFLVDGPSLEAIIMFRPSQQIDERLHVLLNHQSENQITPQELEELEQYVVWDHLMTMLKLKAQLKWAGQNESSK